MDEDPRELFLEMGKSVLLVVSLLGLRYLVSRAFRKEHKKVFEEPKEKEEFIDVESW